MSGSSRTGASSNRRNFPRLTLRCRARIRIGKREYAGYIEDISQGGARVRTLTTIRGAGVVCLILPDLPPMRAHIRWLEPQAGGVCFSISVCGATLMEWAASRLPNADVPKNGPGPTLSDMDDRDIMAARIQQLYSVNIASLHQREKLISAMGR